MRGHAEFRQQDLERQPVCDDEPASGQLRPAGDGDAGAGGQMGPLEAKHPGERGHGKSGQLRDWRGLRQGL